MFEHFELAQESRCCLSDPELCQRGRVMNLGNAQRKCSDQCAAEDRCKFIKLSKNFWRDFGLPLAVSKLCHAARPSEEFFLNINSTDQWLRTVIGYSENLNPNEAETWSYRIPDFDIHSNILPYDPYWSKLQATGDEASTSVSFPLYLLKEALEENTTLEQKWLEWRSTGNEREIPKHGRGKPEETPKLFWKIQAADVHYVHRLDSGSDGIISLVTWRGGNFVRKDFKDLQENNSELGVVKMLSHPHIVYSFGVLYDGTQSSYFMEYMSNSLFNFIVERVERTVPDNEPPFSRYNSVDVLLQIAKAVRHMHHEKVDVVHCDLKSSNILVSVINTSDKEHYLVKVADFGSARLGSTSRSAEGFIPGSGTTRYAAPEVLRKRDEPVRIDDPHKIDVYSFGILAFEVLTGKIDYGGPSSAFKKGVINGTVRPPLRVEVEKQKVFTQDKDLISLIEMCWDADPLQRPSFEEICERLNEIRPRMDQKLPQYDDSPRQANLFWNWMANLFWNWMANLFWNWMAFRGARAH